tara:strand:+ start:4353 stop:5327 length:975 start_codon:yes stop_codon:yes gene_type:complete
MNKNIINIACWSIGQHAIKNMLPAIAECKEVNLSGIYTRNKLRAEEQCKLYECIEYKNETEFLEDHSINAIYLSSPTGVHFEQIEKCLDAGKSVLVEKTALPSLFETEQLIRKAKQKGLVLMEAFMYRFHEQFHTLKAILDSKEFGHPIKIDCEFGFPHLNTDNIRYKRSLSGGALFDAGAYTISSVRTLLNDNVQLKFANLESDKGYEVDTKGFAVLQANTTLCTCTWGFGLSYSNVIRIWTDDTIIVVDKAYSKRETPQNISIFKNGKLENIIEIGAQNHFINMLKYFCDTTKSSLLKEECLSDLYNQSLLLDKVRELGTRT